MSKKIIIFDLDDTLISEKEYVKSGFNAISKYLSNSIGQSHDEIYIKMMELFNEDSEKIFNRLLDFYNVSYDKNYISNLVKIYREHEPKIKLLPDATEILEYLYKNNYRLGMITDGYAIAQRKKIKALEIEKYFDYIVVTDELGRENWKPSEVPYRLLQEKFNSSFDEMIYVGDNVNKDFISANRLGMITVQILRKNGVYKNENIPNEYKSKHVIESLERLKKII